MSPAIEVDGLTFAFGPRRVLYNVGFQVSDGEAVGLAGANGAGKSTLLWCIAGLLRPQAGSVRLSGCKPDREALAHVGFVFQNPEDQLFMPALRDDLALPLLNRGLPLEAAQFKAMAALQAIGLQQYASDPASYLSLGQRKRAAIALAMVREPQLLLLDEPTAELDGRSVRELTGLLCRLPVTMLIASHHLDFLGAVTQRLVVLGESGVLGDGPTSRILGDAALLARAGLV